MKDNNSEEKTSVEWGGVRGALWTLAGAGIATVAQRAGIGGLGGLLGGMPPPPPGGPGAPVTREVVDLLVENATLKANAHADKMNADQMVVNALQQGRIDCLTGRVDRLYTLTQLTVPNGNLNPGYGPAVVAPAPAPVAPPSPDVATIVAAVLAAQKASEASEG